jgi:hypothetical protein
MKALQQKQQSPKAVIAFTSVAGRFGNSGQADYSAANDLVCRMMYALRKQRPGLKALAIDWSAWAQVGMASRGSIPRLMERAGIELLPPEQAAPLVYHEIIHGAEGGEVVLAGSLGLLEQPRRADGGLNLEAANLALSDGAQSHVLLSRITGFDLQRGITIEAELDPTSVPFLKDHALNGIPLLPGVMGIEGFIAAVKYISSVLASEENGFDVERLEDIRFFAPLKFYKDAPRRLIWTARVVKEGEGLVAYVSLETNLRRPGREETKLQHFTGKVYLTLAKGEGREPVVKPPVWNGARAVEAADIYQLYFHGPSFQVLEEVKRSGEGLLGKLRQGMPSMIAEGQPLFSAPLLVELCLQTAGIWEAGSSGALALPGSIGELRLYRNEPDGEPVYATVTPHVDAEGNPIFDASVVDASGRLYLEMKEYRTSRLPYTADARLLEPLRELIKDGKQEG